MRKKTSRVVLGAVSTFVIILFLYLLISTPASSFAMPPTPRKSPSPSHRVRSVSPLPSDVTAIHTAPGFSTILEFQNKPLNAVLGDQDAFKIEFVANSITVKPLFPHAKSNLFVFTEFERFNCELQSGAADNVDYIVSFTRKEKPPDASQSQDISEGAKVGSIFHIHVVNRTEALQGFQLKVVSIASSSPSSESRSAKLIEIELSTKKYPYSFSAQSIGIRQGDWYVPIDSIYLDNLNLQPGDPVIHGKIAVLEQDLRPKIPVMVVFAVSDPKRKSKILRLQVPAVALSQNGNKAQPAQKKGDPFYGVIPAQNR